jgi:hypothetical protein
MTSDAIYNNEPMDTLHKVMVRVNKSAMHLASMQAVTTSYDPTRVHVINFSGATMIKDPHQQKDKHSNQQNSGKDKRATASSSSSDYKNKTKNNSKESNSGSVRILCTGCGKPHSGECRFKNHKYYNPTSTPYKESDQGKEVYRLYQKTSLYDPSVSESNNNKNKQSSKPYNKKKSKGIPSFDDSSKTSNEDTAGVACLNEITYSNGVTCNCVLHRYLSGLSMEDDTRSAYVNAILKAPDGSRLTVKVLIDTGATTASYINTTIARWLQDHGSTLLEKHSNMLVCSILNNSSNENNHCEKSRGVLHLNIEFEKVTNVSTGTLTIERLPADIVQLEDNILIIGLPQIREWDILSVFAPFYSRVEAELQTPQPAGEYCQTIGSIRHECDRCNDSGTLGIHNLTPKRSHGTQPHIVQTLSHILPKLISSLETRVQIATVLRRCGQADLKKVVKYVKSTDIFTDVIYDDAEIPDDHIRYEPDEHMEENCPTSVKMHGSPSLQAKCASLVNQYAHIFSETVSAYPAKVPPLVIEIKQDQWHSPKHRLPPRVQSPQKEAELRRQVDLLVRLGVVEPVSTAQAWSQVLLVPKPNGAWRFCVDYILLNLLILWNSWPLPNIKQMLERIGLKRPKYFAVFDLTSGYHQAPISKSSKIFTAFITSFGVYQWTRVPMGLKTAGSYFQYIMATVVLLGLLYVICECYLDDILIYGKTEDEFVRNCETVFKAFDKANIKINPKKGKMGLEEIEYVG